MRSSAFIGLCLLAGTCSAEDLAFEDFAASPPSQQVLRDVIPPEAEHSPFLSRAVGQTANFAGKYVLTINGCGTACQQVAAIDVETGKVHLPGEGVASNGACYRLDSRLLVLNPIAPDAQQKPTGFRTDFYEMTATGFTLISSTDAGTTLNCGTR